MSDRLAPRPTAEEPRQPVTGTSRRTLLLAFRSSAAAACVTYLVNLLILPFVLSHVGTDLYGAWVTVASILLIGALADAGIRTEIIRRVGVAKGAGDEREIVRAVHQGITLLGVFALVTVAIGWVTAPSIRHFAFPGGVAGYSASQLELVIRATIMLLAVSLTGSAYFGVLRGVQRGDIETTAQMLAVPVGAAACVIGVAAGGGLWALFAGSAAQVTVLLAWQWRGARRVVPSLRLRFVRLNRVTARAYLALSGLALLSQVSDVVDSQWDKIVLSHFVGSSEVASFQVGTSLVLQGKALALLPLVPLMVAIAELRSREPERMERLFRLLARGGAVFGAIVLSAVFVFAPAFVALWLGEGLAQAGTAARLFVVAVAANLVSAALAYRAFGEGWHGLAATGAVVNMVINGVLSLVLTMAIGFNGALYGSIAGNAAGTLVFLPLMRRRMGDRWTPPPLRALVVGVAMAGAAVLLGIDSASSWPLLVPCVIGYVAVTGWACVRAEGLAVRSVLMRAP